MATRPNADLNARLKSLVPNEPALTSGEVRHSVLLRPSYPFHRPALISARFGSSGSLRVFMGLWWEIVPDGESDLPTIHEAEASLSPERAAALQRILDECVPSLETPVLMRGLDGINIVYEITSGAALTRRFTGWSPRPGKPDHTYLATLHALALEMLPDEQAQQTLELLNSHLNLGLPLRVRATRR